MTVAAFPPEENTPLSPISYRFQQSMPPDVPYGNRNNDFLHEASKMPACGPRILQHEMPLDPG